MLKKMLCIMVIIAGLTACTPTNENNTEPQPTKSPEEVEKALSGLIEERDEVEGISFYYAQTTIENKNKNNNDVFVYFSNRNGDVRNLRFVINYTGTVPLNPKWLKIRADDELFESRVDLVIQSSSNLYYAQEFYDTSVFFDDYKMIMAMAKAEKAIVRLSGLSYSGDIELSKRQKQAMLNVINAYLNAGGDTSNFIN
ncbi:hypothetical protein R70723_15890 [Paenibacillus sp. FSL R7-0273]|uniref:hypothetical protein n=2 Tax=Paenibacillus sp. FSL R7-0273 TaxID=1536772 RepID=UPI0004F92755|nr:hypothetical protein [Paenibacillus sp. FSL R7-0273]AIQ47201.1 hypothetical protein R70723_15890 [Paenibacillus sp. FSL R7-0273]OMF91520.1 hypothetical protein BK144_15095 [Paenibacillus sp. FSL R7-0273]